MGSNPLRVVSLLPSATDILAGAGAVDLLVGRSHECNWPSGVERLPILTGAVNQFVNSKQMDDVVNASLERGEGLYFLEQELLKELKPDVIVTQDLCNVCSVDLQLVQKTVDQLSIKPRIVTLNPQKLSDVLEDIVKVGKAVGCQQQSETTVTALKQRVHKAREVAKGASKDRKPITVAFVEWLDPLFVGGHWTPEMIQMAGATHPLNKPIGKGGAGPSIRIPNEALVEADCDWIIVCPCGFTIEDTKKEEHLLSTKSWWQNLRAVKEGRVAIVDGNQMFARPGPRLVDALEFLVGLLHNRPDLIPADFPWTWWDTQKTTALAVSKPNSQSPDTNGKASSKAGKDSSQLLNGSSSDSADVSSQVPDSSSSSSSGADVACNGTASNSFALPVGSSSQDRADTPRPGGKQLTAAEQAGGATQGGASKAGQQTAQQSKQALQSGVQNGSKAGQQTAEQSEKSSGSAEGKVRQGSGERKWGAAPFLGAEIEEAHAAAIHAGQPTYTDPATGYKVITEQNLRQQSVCCANRCRHCPFGHYKVPANRGPKINTITRPTVLKINRKDTPSSTSTFVLWPGIGNISPDQADVTQCAKVSIKMVEGMPVNASSHDSTSSTTTSLEAASKLKGAKRGDSSKSPQSGSSTDEETAVSDTVYVAAFEQGSGKVWGCAVSTLHDAMDDCLQSGHVLVVLPSCQHQSAYSMIEADRVGKSARMLCC